MSPLGELVTAGLLLILAAACLLDRHLLRACLAFFGFALLVALAWWHLGVPWLALAEVVLGALLTGTALLHGLGYPDARSPLPLRDPTCRPRHQAPIRWLAALVWLTLTAVAVWTIAGGDELVLSAEVTRRPLLVTGLTIMALGLWAFAHHLHLLRRLLAFNVLGSGVFLLLAGLAGPTLEVQGLILVGLVVALVGSLLGAALLRRLYVLGGRVTLDPEADRRP